MVRLLILAVLASVAVDAALIWWGRTGFVPLELVAVGGGLLAILLAILGASIYAFNRGRSDPAASLTLRSILLSIIVFLSFFAAVPITRRLITKDVLAARDRADDLRPVLEARRAISGAYPDSLEAIADPADLPPLLRRPYAYRGTVTSYVFRIRIPGTAADVVELHSGEGRWRTVHP